MADKTVTSLFHDRTAATAAVDRLTAAGLNRSQITIYDKSDTTTDLSAANRTPAASQAAPYAGTADAATTHATYGTDNLADQLKDVGVDDADAHAYAEGVRRGDILVVVACDADQVDLVTDLLDRDGLHDLDERRTAWRSEGWQDYQAPATSVPTTGRVEPVSRGRVRIHSPRA